ncbi:hypothetical protein D1007_24711 [Hordeum vulgare]|nr:hypothetical protein D1007_24711 [Hordeum vulgare]
MLMLLMGVFLPDKVMKTEWDRVGGGALVISGAEAVVDFIPTNHWLNMVNLPGRVAFMRDEEDIVVLIIPPKFMEVMKEWLMVKLSANKWCKFWVQVQNFDGTMVLGICRRHQILPDNLVVLRISSLCVEVQDYNHDSSIGCRMRRRRHNCTGDVAFAL